MPELPEVEHAVQLLNELGAGRTIVKVETTEDTIVYSDVTHTDFAETLTGRKMIQARRYGKVFYMQLDGEGKHPVMHFGMTGLLHVKGQSPILYKSTSDAPDPGWPPRWMKFILHFANPESGQTTEIAFRDPRRLGRIRLCASPPSEPPISGLGFDPIHTMPPLTVFSNLVRNHKKIAIKALLLDQSFSAGVGNWMADEILYHARIHPQQRSNTLMEDQIEALHQKIVYVCEAATTVNANSSKFPENWLFKHRWKNGATNPFPRAKPSGEPATIKWVSVGGRTSAFVVELQKLFAPSLVDEGQPETSSTSRLRSTKKRRQVDNEPESGRVVNPSRTAQRIARRHAGHVDGRV